MPRNLPGQEAYSTQTSEPSSGRTQDGSLILEISNLNLDDFNSLGVIVTRMDPDEKEEASGGYLIQALVP